MAHELADGAPRLLLVTAAAGYGKTSAVRSRLRGVPVSWYSGSAAAAMLRRAEPGRAAARWLVLDEPALSPAELGRALTEAMATTPERRIAVITARLPEIPTARWRASGLMAELGPAQLALSPSSAARTLRGEYGLDDATAGLLVRATAGWPALVRLAGQAAAGQRSPHQVLELLGGPESVVADYLIQEVCDKLDPRVLRALDHASHLGSVTSDALDFDDGSALTALARAGLVVPAGFGPLRYHVVPLLAAVVRARRPQNTATRRQWSERAAADLVAKGWHGEAAEAHQRAGDLRASAQILEQHGARILARDGLLAVIDLVEALPEELRTAGVRQAYGEALALTGDTDGARAQYRHLTGGAEATGGKLSPGLARRLGYLDYRAGDPLSALRLYAQGYHEEDQSAEAALLVAWMSVAHWAAGDTKSAATAAETAQRVALASGDYRPMIAAHVALGLTAEIRGESAAEQRHFGKALELAAANGDVVQEAMAGNNHAARLLGEGRLAEAFAAAERSVYLCEAIGLRAMLGMALNNAGGALRQLGRLDEALDRFERAVAVEHRVGSAWLAYPLVDIGDIHRLRGNAQLARAAYEEAVRIATDTEDRYGLVPGLAGLALVLADLEPDEARYAAERALRHAEGPMRVEALLAAGHAARGRGDAAEAVRIADEAAEQARFFRDRPRLAHALELAAVAGTVPRASKRGLNEALQIWQEVGAALDADRVRAILGSRTDAGAPERVAARLARERLAAAGMPLPAYAVGGSGGGVEIRTLGRLTILIGGEPLPATAWQSRKARDLLRILIARRGRPVPREEIGQLLWGDDDPGPVGHRLSVALSTVRSVLDPGRRHPADYFLIADSGSIALDTTRVAVDVERFLSEADHGLRLHERGESAQALEALAAAERAYTGDFLEDEPYDESTVAVRETARATYLHLVRVLAELYRRIGDTAGCLRSLHHVLDKDPYDEPCHREIIDLLEAAGSHGQARRARDRYAAAMRDLDLDE
ncbi:BTAD domain-containing putative transcriptional regulator [Actinospica robiniae]|uniref:BTAD domain-containing putative transcriptional regulator n=1 Tax=Actinospica robiniae TaxID=304901 RepID=UPI000422232A|nr:BTAD domain-containing putative transcriptional regulator [Actinospica robiniae]